MLPLARVSPLLPIAMAVALLTGAEAQAPPERPAQPASTTEQQPKPPGKPVLATTPEEEPPTPQENRDALAEAARLAELAGRPVKEVQVVGRGPATFNIAPELLPLKAGEPFERARLRSSVQALYKTGRFADIAVESDPAADGGVIVRFRVEPNYFIGQVTVVGAPSPPTQNQMVTSSKLQLGERFSREQVNQSMERMARQLQEHGYYQAQIDANLKFHEETQQVDVTFQVTPGERARVGKVQIEGEPGYPTEELLNVAKFHGGDPVTVSRVNRALSRLRKRYQKKEWLEAQVSITERTYQPQTNTVDYIFRIVRGPKVDIRLEGARLSRRKIRKYVPVYEESAVDADLLNEGRRNLRDYFQTQGFFDVEIGWTENKVDAGRRLIIYDVNRGERHRLEEVRIEGNRYFPDDLIRERLRVQPASMLLAHGRFSQAMLSRDREAVEALYQTNGFQQVKVETVVDDNVGGEEGRMRVTFRVEEGPQTRVESVRFQGLRAVTEDEVRGLINTTEGQPYSAASIAQDRDSIVNYYFNKGFPDVKFEAFTESLNGVERVNVTFRIDEGRQVFVEDVLVTGLNFTRPTIVERELEIDSGDPLSQNSMLESQRRLYDMGIFNQVEVAVQNPEGIAARKKVLFQVEEAKRYTFTYGFGLEVGSGDSDNANPADDETRVSPRVSFDVTRINFMGRDHTIVFKSRVSRVQQRVAFSYEAPRWFGRPNWTMTFNAFYDFTREVRTFTAKRLEGSAQLEQRWSKATTLLYRFSYRRVGLQDVKIFDRDIVPLLARPDRTGMPSVTYIRDTRNDPIDSIRGMLTTVDFGVSSKFFGSQAGFTRLLVQNSTYHPFGKRRWVFARATRLGIMNPLEDDELIPLPERFFAGGGNSHRGFGINQAGPRDLQSGFPIGGAALFVNQSELRTPPLALPFVEDNLSAVVFHDMGNVFSGAGTLPRDLLRLRQLPPGECGRLDPTARCNFNYVSHAIGAGVRYRTPIGPVRVDLGYNLNPTTYPRRQPGTPSIETTRRINFFFSIGQTF